MKKILLILILVFGYTILYCQSLKPDVISSAGSFYANAANSISWTIGECITETFSSSEYKLTQGFQQGIYEINTLTENSDNLMKIDLFPNPTTEFVNLEILAQENKTCFYRLLSRLASV